MLPLKEYPFAERPMIVAHRGDTSFGAPGNSLAAIESALNSGADMIELDVQLTADNKFVCYHDEVHPALDAPVFQSSFRDLHANQVPSLIESLALGKDRAYFNLEVKDYSSRDPKLYMRALVQLLMEFQWDKLMLLSSFRPDYLREAGWMIPTCIIHPDEATKDTLASRSFGEPIIFDRPLGSYYPSELMGIAHATGYACQLSELTPSALADIQSKNIFLGVYPISTEPEFNEAVAYGARAIVCEQPGKFAKLRNARFAAGL